MSVLVVGGAGYIGAHVVRQLWQRGEKAVVVDDLSTGVEARVTGNHLEVLDLLAAGSTVQLSEIMRNNEVKSVIHFAALKAASESVEEPVRYYRHNMGALQTVLEAMELAGLRGLVFSSSAAVYGTAEPPLIETTPPQPVNPYGETKLVGEWLVDGAARARHLNAVSLRYFNVAGASAPELGDTSANNLIPMTFDRLSAGQPPRIFGDDYNTPDGTCIRDYVHVSDVAEAHLAALDGLQPGHRIYNVGTGEGTSVREIIDLVRDISGRDFEPEIAPRRPGDPEVVVATVDRIRNELGWSAKLTTRDAVESAWAAHQLAIT